MFNVTLINDNILELTELFTVGLRFAGAATPRVTLVPAQANIVILDDDGEFLQCKAIHVHQAWSIRGN